MQSTVRIYQKHLIITHEEINDKSVEGVRHRYQPGFLFNSTQMQLLVHMTQATSFDEFIEMMEAFKQAN